MNTAINEGLIIKKLESSYRRKTVIPNLDLDEIPYGTLVGLIGPNAAGKSTLLKSLAGIQPYTGLATLNGDNLKSMSGNERLNKIGYLPQALPLASSLLVYECILSASRMANPIQGSAEADRKIEHILDILHLKKEAFQRVSELSGGKRQLVGLAQVLIRETFLMLLDEPTSALDLKRQIQVFSHVRKAVKDQNRIAIIAAHDINLTMRFCDHVLVLSNGHAVASGAPESVITSDILRDVYGVEARVERCSKGHPIILADNIADQKLQDKKHD